jgi:hypothetical protein
MNSVHVMPGAIDYGDAPEYFVSGYAMVTRVSAGVIRETFYTVRVLTDGTTERKVTHHLLWDAGEWLAAHRPEMVAEVERLRPAAAARQDGEAALH